MSVEKFLQELANKLLDRSEEVLETVKGLPHDSFNKLLFDSVSNVYLAESQFCIDLAKEIVKFVDNMKEDK